MQEKEILQNDFTIRDGLRIFFEKSSLLLITLCVALVATYIGIKFITPTYQAKVKLLISGQKEIESPFYKEIFYTRSADIVLTQSEIVKSKVVLERTVRILELDKRVPTLKQYNSAIKNTTLNLLDFLKSIPQNFKKIIVHRIMKKPEEKKLSDFQKAMDLLKKNIKVKRIVDTDVFEITVSDYSPAMAKNIANVLSRSYVLFDLEQQLAEAKLKFGEKYPMVLQLNDNIAKMNLDLSKDISDTEAIGPASVKIIEQAIEPVRPISPNKSLIYALVLAISLMAAVLVIIFYAYFDQSFKSPRDIEDYLGVPLLGSLPMLRKNTGLFKNRLEKDTRFFNKQINIFADQVYLLSKDKKIQSIIFTGVDSKEGSTKIVYNLAKSISKNHGHKTVVVDFNLRQPELHKLFTVENRPGLSEVLEGKEKLEKCLKKIDSHLSVLTCGQTELNPLVLLNSAKITELFEALKESFDLVIIDAPFLKDYKDTYVLSEKADGMIIIIDITRARRQIVDMYTKIFKKEDKLLGTVFNKRLYHIPEVIYRNL